MPQRTARCQVCGSEFALRDLLPGEVVRPSLVRLIERDFPTWDSAGYICRTDLNRAREQYVKAALQDELGELSELDNQVVQSLREREVLSTDIYADFDAAQRFGDRLSDRIASFGGSWRFIIAFTLLLAVWITLNSIALFAKPFDPYPFILLNLVLSTLAAIQAPLIMMSQNRMEARDRLRSEHDYKINLKAELEIRHLHEKVDHLLKQQWQRLVEIQQIQLELMEELAARRK